MAPREGFEPPRQKTVDFESTAIPGYAISAGESGSRMLVIRMMEGRKYNELILAFAIQSAPILYLVYWRGCHKDDGVR